MKSDDAITRRQFVTTAAAVAGGVLLPKSVFSSAPRAALADNAHREERLLSLEKGAWKVRPFPMTQVRLKNGVIQRSHGSQSSLPAVTAP